MQNKARLELADYEAENLARLQKMFSRKWDTIFMQAEAQSKVDKKRDKQERKILDTQERAFWDVYRPPPGCINTTELDIKKVCKLQNTPPAADNLRYRTVFYFTTAFFNSIIVFICYVKTIILLKST